MSLPSREQTPLRIGVDVGGTFTDLVCLDSQSGALRVVKLPSTPPDFHVAVIDAVHRARGTNRDFEVVHGSTVATNALLQRAGEPIAFVTTDGFRDMLLIGRQDRPSLYALHVTRPQPLALAEHCFTIRERMDAGGNVIEALTEPEIDRVVEGIRAAGLRHVAVCLLFSFVNPEHEQRIAARCEAAGMTVSLSSQVLPEFREYERASTTAVNASLRPVVSRYLDQLEHGLFGENTAANSAASEDAMARQSRLRIMHSAGGTLSVVKARAAAARLILSGPAGGLIGAAAIAKIAGFDNLITCDMGGTSTDVATIIDGQPSWTSSTIVDGLPIGLPAFDIQTVGAGGGSIAFLDAGGALRVGPRSAGAIPGPACYGRGGTEPTVTDANLVLGRIQLDNFAGGSIRLDPERARAAIEPLAADMGKTTVDTALGIIRVTESNMARAIRAVTSRRGLDPRSFKLLSFGGAAGLHACALAESLDIRSVVIPPYCGVLSALGMAVAAPVADASKTVLQLRSALDDSRLAAEYGLLSGQTMDAIPYERTTLVEAFADVRFKGQSHEIKVRVQRPDRDVIAKAFLTAYEQRYGTPPSGRDIEIVTLRVRRTGQGATLTLPFLEPAARMERFVNLIGSDGAAVRAAASRRTQLLGTEHRFLGPMLILDDDATSYVAPGWEGTVRPDGTVVLSRTSASAASSEA